MEAKVIGHWNVPFRKGLYVNLSHLNEHGRQMKRAVARWVASSGDRGLADDNQRFDHRPHQVVASERIVRVFDIEALYDALDHERAVRGITWERLTREMNETFNGVPRSTADRHVNGKAWVIQAIGAERCSPSLCCHLASSRFATKADDRGTPALVGSESNAIASESCLNSS